MFFQRMAGNRNPAAAVLPSGGFKNEFDRSVLYDQAYGDYDDGDSNNYYSDSDYSENVSGGGQNTQFADSRASNSQYGNGAGSNAQSRPSSGDDYYDYYPDGNSDSYYDYPGQDGAGGSHSSKDESNFYDYGGRDPSSRGTEPTNDGNYYRESNDGSYSISQNNKDDFSNSEDSRSDRRGDDLHQGHSQGHNSDYADSRRPANYDEYYYYDDEPGSDNPGRDSGSNYDYNAYDDDDYPGNDYPNNNDNNHYYDSPGSKISDAAPDVGGYVENYNLDTPLRGGAGHEDTPPSRNAYLRGDGYVESGQSYRPEPEVATQKADSSLTDTATGQGAAADRDQIFDAVKAGTEGSLSQGSQGSQGSANTGGVKKRNIPSFKKNEHEFVKDGGWVGEGTPTVASTSLLIV